MSIELTKAQKLLAYLICNHNCPFTPVVVMKLAYLIDLVSIKCTKNQIFNYTYIRWNWGPFDKKIYDDLNALALANYIILKTCYLGSNIEYTAYEYNKRKNGNLFKGIEKPEKKIIDEVLSSVRGYGAKTLTEIAYQTKPMKKLKATIGGKEGLGRELNLYIH
jgi:uncharacterized phage-associated protein